MNERPGAGATLRVEVAAAPNPGLLRAAIEARLAGRPWAHGPEAAMADEVARTVALTGTDADARSERDPWR